MEEFYTVFVVDESFHLLGTVPLDQLILADPLQRVIDLYFNTVGFKMNNFILDELRLVSRRFPRPEVEKVFARAGKNDIRSLGWVVRELYRASRRQNSGKKPKT